MSVSPGRRVLVPGAPAGGPGAAKDHSLAVELADAAGEVLLAVRGELGFGDPNALRAAGDRAAQAALADALARARPDDAVLSEEAPDTTSRLVSDRVWIIDPLDGTREYSEEGRTDWAVHVALWQCGELVAAAVALPARGITLSTGQRHDAPRQDSRPLRVAVSRTRAPAIAQEVAQSLGAELVPMGSSGAKTSAVILGDVDAYIHAGGQYEWDSAAPLAVAVAHGLHGSRLDGSPMRYNQPNPYLPDLLICLPHLAGPILKLTAATEAPQ